MSQRKNLKPYLTAMLDGSFDVFYFVKDGNKIIPKRENIQGQQAAKIFMETKECLLIVDKIEGWRKQRAYVTEHYGAYNYNMQCETLKKIEQGVAWCRKCPALSKKMMLQLLEEKFLPYIEVCAPGKKSKYYKACKELQDELQEWIDQVTFKTWEPIV